MKTTIDYGGDYSGQPSDYQTTMKQEFTCDYLVDITGLVDDGRNLYSCCHPSGVMCGKEDCPVVIDFYKRCQKDVEANDYESLTRGKLCPLKALEPPILFFGNMDSAPDIAATLKTGMIKYRVDGELPRVEYIGGQCDGSRCAWYDEMKEQCAILRLARSVTRSVTHK